MTKKITNKLTASPLAAPTVLVTVQTEGKIPNIITIAWTGILCSTPPTVYIGVQPTR